MSRHESFVCVTPLILICDCKIQRVGGMAEGVCRLSTASEFLFEWMIVWMNDCLNEWLFAPDAYSVTIYTWLIQCDLTAFVWHASVICVTGNTRVRGGMQLDSIHMNAFYDTHINESHLTHMNESCHTEWAMAYIRGMVPIPIGSTIISSSSSFMGQTWRCLPPLSSTFHLHPPPFPTRTDPHTRYLPVSLSLLHTRCAAFED